MAYESILEWYSGKSRNVMITFVIPALVESAALGYWKKGVARQVRAALNKQNVAAKWSREVEKALEVDWAHPLRDGLMNMRYGSYGHAPRMFAPEALAKLHAIPYSFTKGGLVQDVGAVISRWARTNAEVAERVALLDARRPKPVVVMKTLSPTVAENVSRHIGIDVATIQSPPMHGEWIEHVHKGAKSLVFEIVIDWPEGTQHNKSRFLHSGNHSQCQACGHAIKDPFNWVPILAYGPEPLEQQLLDVAAKTVPYALWVGRDCAQRLFGCEVEGDAIYKERGQDTPASAVPPRS
jgi:hypothetical protein